jgi:hypothetical protein
LKEALNTAALEGSAWVKVRATRAAVNTAPSVAIPDASDRATWRYSAPDILASDAVSADNFKCAASNAAANATTEAAKALTVARPVDPAIAAREEDSDRPRIMDPAIVAIEAAEDLEVFRLADPLVVAMAAGKL